MHRFQLFCRNQISQWTHPSSKALTPSWRKFLSYRSQSIDLFCKSVDWCHEIFKMLIIHHTPRVFLHVVKHNSFLLLLGFSFTNICNLQDIRWRGLSHILSTNPTCFTDTQTLVGLLLQTAHPCAQLVAGIENETFGIHSLEFTLSILALVAVVVRKMLKTQVTGKYFLCLIRSN